MVLLVLLAKQDCLAQMAQQAKMEHQEFVGHQVRQVIQDLLVESGLQDPREIKVQRALKVIQVPKALLVTEDHAAIQVPRGHLELQGSPERMAMMVLLALQGCQAQKATLVPQALPGPLVRRVQMVLLANLGRKVQWAHQEPQGRQGAQEHLVLPGSPFLGLRGLQDRLVHLVIRQSTLISAKSKVM